MKINHVRHNLLNLKLLLLFIILPVSLMSQTEEYFIHQTPIGLLALKIDKSNLRFVYSGKAGISSSISYGSLVKIDSLIYQIKCDELLPVTFNQQSDSLNKLYSITLNTKFLKEELPQFERIGIIVNEQEYDILKNKKIIKTRFTFKKSIGSISFFVVLKVGKNRFESDVFVPNGDANRFELSYNDEGLGLWYFNRFIDKNIIKIRGDSLEYFDSNHSENMIFKKMDPEEINSKYKIVFNTFYLNDPQNRLQEKTH